MVAPRATYRGLDVALFWRSYRRLIDDVFVHYSAIKSEGYRTLAEGQSVTYDAEQGPKGYHATQVFLNGN